MPAFLNSNSNVEYNQPLTTWLADAVTTGIWDQSSRQIAVGLINNMPDGALESTERQFLSLLDEASGDLRVRLTLYSLPGIYRNGRAASHVSTYYSGIESLLKSRLDGLIVTGREPSAANLADEPYWKDFTRVVEWARKNTYSAVWSCLAAHAAVLYCDGLGRVKSRSKYCGVFDCSLVAGHRLMDGIAPHIHLPHSRWNGVAESALRTHGYSVLTRSAEVGVDTFVKEYKSLFVFFQGHPEYDSDTLLLEYRRDVGRYLRGESDRYPAMPKNYFTAEAAAILQAYQNEAARGPQRELPAEIHETLLRAKTERMWQPEAVRIYRNWLDYIVAQKRARIQDSKSANAKPAAFDRAVIPISFAGVAASSGAAKRHTNAREKQRRAAVG